MNDNLRPSLGGVVKSTCAIVGPWVEAAVTVLVTGVAIK